MTVAYNSILSNTLLSLYFNFTKNYVIIIYMKANSQGLSPTALRAKRARYKAAAMTPKRRKRKAENQRIGQRSDSDLHHTRSGTVRRTSIAYNRATHTRKEV